MDSGNNLRAVEGVGEGDVVHLFLISFVSLTLADGTDIYLDPATKSLDTLGKIRNLSQVILARFDTPFLNHSVKSAS
mgnify:CR=1 FL=1